MENEGFCVWALLTVVFSGVYFQFSTFYPRESIQWYLFIVSGNLLLVTSVLVFATLFGISGIQKLVQSVDFP